MKFFIAATVLTFCLLPAAHAETIHLEKFDQLKLANLIGSLPVSVRTKKVISLTEPTRGLRVISRFPKTNSAFLIECDSSYFNGSAYPSYYECTVEIDPNHQQLEKGYDVIKGKFTAAWTRALYETIPYGSPRKEMYSYGRDEGLNFEGKKDNIFHFYFSCLPDECELKFSAKTAAPGESVSEI